MIAPVRVATSTITSGCSRLAATSPSASTSRPSASVLSTSTVVPSRMRSTSPGPRRAAGRHVVGDAQPRRDPDRQRRSSATARSTASTVAAPVMSYFMPTMRGRGLERQAAGVEGDALADERDVARRAGGRVVEADEPRRPVRALADAEDAAVAAVARARPRRAPRRSTGSPATELRRPRRRSPRVRATPRGSTRGPSRARRRSPRPRSPRVAAASARAAPCTMTRDARAFGASDL